MRRRDDERGRRDSSDQDRGYYRRNDEHLRFQDHYDDERSRRGDRSSESFRESNRRDSDRRDSERYDSYSSGNSGRGDNDYRGRDRYSMPGSDRREELDSRSRYDRSGRGDYDDYSQQSRGSSYRSGTGNRGDQWGSERSSRSDHYDERRTRGYDPGQGSDYNESRLGSFDYDNYRSRDRYDEPGTRDRRYDDHDRSRNRGSERSDLSRSERSRSDYRSDRERGESGSRDSRNSRNHDISGDWRRFESWGHESYGDQRGQGIGWHRRDSYHDDFWDQDEGSSTDRRS